MSQIDIMKALLLVSALVLVVSCGKYERPFISFQSPEKRLMDKTWRCVKAVDADGNEFEVYDHLTFEINGSDSTISRTTNHSSFTSDYTNMDTTSLTGIWSWGYALEGNFNKQLISLVTDAHGTRHNRVTVLSKKELVIQDQKVICLSQIHLN